VGSVWSGQLYLVGWAGSMTALVYVEHVFNVCGHLTSRKRNRLCKKLANRASLKVNNKFYD